MSLDPSSMSADELQRQIELIQQQIAAAAAAEAEKAAQQQEEEEYEEYDEEIVEEEIIEEEVEEEEELPPPKPARYVPPPPKPKAAGEIPAWKLKQMEREAEKAEQQRLAEDERAARGRSAAYNTGRSIQKPASHDENVVRQESLKKQHGWEKPGWAAAVDDVPPDQSVISDPINNPLLKPKGGPGYQRQVKEKDLEIIKGTFVNPSTTQKLEPRLTWVVLNVNKRKVGKIVMHLYGKDVPGLVDQFIGLKGYEMERQNGELSIVGMEPTLHITSKSRNGLESKAGVYGVIQEGMDIFQTVMNSAADAVITVKQAHIYPVKKGSSGL